MVIARIESGTSGKTTGVIASRRNVRAPRTSRILSGYSSPPARGSGQYLLDPLPADCGLAVSGDEDLGLQLQGAP